MKPLPSYAQKKRAAGREEKKEDFSLLQESRNRHPERERERGWK